MKKVQTKNKLKGFFGLFAAFALAIGVGVSLAPKDAVKTQAADTLVNSFNFLDGGDSKNSAYAGTNLATNVSYASDNPSGTSGTTAWEADYANLNETIRTRLGGKLVSTVQTDDTTAWANIRTKFTFAVAVSKVEILGASTFGSAANNKSNYLQYSTSGSTWTTVGTLTNPGTTATTLSFEGLSIPVNSYLRFGVQLDASGTNAGLQFTGIRVYTEAVPSGSSVTSLSVNPQSKSLLTTSALVASDYTVSITKDGVAGSSADYTAQIGTGTGASFSGTDIEWGVTKPKVSDKTIQFKAKYPNAIGGSTYLTTEVALTVTEPVFGTLSSIAIKTPATKTTFEVGETFNREGLVITASDNSVPVISKDLNTGFSTNFDGTTFDAEDIGSKTVTISYTEGATKTVTYSITVIAFVPVHKFSPKGFGGYTTNGFAADDQTGTVGTSNTTLALRVFNGSNGQVRGNKSTIEENFSMRNIDIYPGYIRKIVLNGTGGTNFTASATRSLVNVGNTAYTLDNAENGTKVQGVYTSSGGVHTLTWTIPENIDARYFILHNLQASGTMLAGADDAIQIFYELIPDTFGTLDHITVDTSSSMLKKTFYVGEPLVTSGLLVTAFDTLDKELITNEYTTNPAVGYNFQQSDLGTKTINVTFEKGGVSKSSSYTVQVLRAQTYTKLSGANDIRYGQMYALGTVDGAASTTMSTVVSEVGVDYNVESDTFLSVTNLQLVALRIGVVKGSYALQLLNGPETDKYYSWTAGNELNVSSEINAASSWYIAFDDGTLKITNSSESSRFIGHNHSSARFAAYTGSTSAPASLYMDFGSYEVEQEAMTLADAVNNGIGEGANKSCHAAYEFLSDVYSRLSVDGKAFFDTDEDYEVVISARERMLYLAAWTAANAGTPDEKINSPVNDNNSLTATIIIGVVGLTTLAGYYFLQKKKEA